MGRQPPAPAQSMAGHCVRRKKGRNRIAMNTAELVAVEIGIVLGAVILLGTLTVAWAMVGPLERKKRNGRTSRSLKRKRGLRWGSSRPRRSQAFFQGSRPAP